MLGPELEEAPLAPDAAKLPAALLVDSTARACGGGTRAYEGGCEECKECEQRERGAGAEEHGETEA